MKEYKLITAHIETAAADNESGSISHSIKDFFFANAYSDAPDAQKVEALMQKMNQDGWEVVSVAPTDAFRTSGEVLITFEREA